MTLLPQISARGCSSSIEGGKTPEVPGKSAGAAANTNNNESSRLGDAAQQFEAVFLRQILSSVERAASVQGEKAAGSNLYGSMLVDAVADSISRSGGMGLASMLVHSIQPRLDHSNTSPGSFGKVPGADSGVNGDAVRTYNKAPLTKEPAKVPGQELGGPR